MLGIFEVSFRRWILDLSRRLTATPAYAAPELIHAVMKKQIRSLPKLKSTINLYKADVFSLGLVYWYIIMRIEPTNFNQDPKLLAKGMSQLAQSTNRDRQLVDLIIRMTEYDPSKRPSFWELLTTAERWHARADNVLSAVKGIFGFTG